MEKLELNMRRNRVDHALILTSYMVTPGRPSTHQCDCRDPRPAPLSVVAGLNYEHFTPEHLAELVAYVQAGRSAGSSSTPAISRSIRATRCGRRPMSLPPSTSCPVMIHTGDTYSPKGKLKYAHPLHVDEVAVDFPDVRFVICHLGNPWIRDCMEVVYKNANVYTRHFRPALGVFEDRFESFMRKQVQEMLVYGVEPDAVLYGTDWPISSMESYLEFMKTLAIPEKDRSKIMAGNAAELFGLPLQNSLFHAR